MKKEKLTWKRLFEYVRDHVPDASFVEDELREYRKEFFPPERAAEMVGLDPKRI